MGVIIKVDETYYKMLKGIDIITKINSIFCL